MIPFAVKQVWFWLALTGLVQCWITFMYFGRNVGGLWGRLYYCVFVTLLEGVFCIGMVWHMDPSRMPRHFCIAQVILISLASFALTGVCASFALACARAVFRPRSVNTGRAVLAWHPRYIPLLMIFPIAACITHACLTITFDAVQPSLSDDLHCDATHPVWIRLAGYAGVPLIITIPFLALSVCTAYRMYRVRSISYSRGTYVMDDGDDDSGPSVISPYIPDGPKKRSTLSLNTFLPYPSKAWFKKPDVVSPFSKDTFDKEPPVYPLHKHPFPVVDPITGNPYSPVEGRDIAPFTMSATSLRIAHKQAEPHQHHTSPDLSQDDRNIRARSNTPDSATSSTIPAFITNPAIRSALRPTKVSDAALASGSSVRLDPLGETDDMQVGLAITTGDTPSPCVSSDAVFVDGGAAVGLAVTTDEPERERTPTPMLQYTIPSSPEREGSASPVPSDAHIAQDTSQPHDSNPPERARSSESITHASSSVGHQITQSFSPISPLASHPPPLLLRHDRQASLVSSGTLYSANVQPHRENWGLLPPLTASTIQSPMTWKDKSEESPHELRTMHAASRDQDKIDEEAKNAEWEDSEFDHDLPIRSYRRDPRERLGMYNPTPLPEQTAVSFEQRRQSLRMEIPSDGGTKKLGNAIWRMILFQIAFFTVQLLACLSPMLDAAHNTVTPFGTQHVALILAAWGPLCIFANVPRIFCLRRRSR